MRNFTRPDELHFQAANGWLELGSWLEANEELENITPQMRVHPDVLALRCEIYGRAEKWHACVDIAETFVNFKPSRAEGWIHRSYALHALLHTQEAFDKLVPAAKQFPNVWTIPYNLACYCAQLGRFDEAKAWFKKALRVDGRAVQRAGIDDPDLKPLWKSMGRTRWEPE